MTSPVTLFPREETGPQAPVQIYLQPISAPSILGLYGFAGATFMVAAMVAAHMAHWFGGTRTDLYLALRRGVSQT